MNHVGLRGGLGLALASAASFATSGPFAKALAESGWSPGAAVTVRVVGAALLLLGPAVVLLRGRWGVLRANAWHVASFGLVAVAACQLFYFNAVQTLSVGVALLLEYLGIVLVVLWLWARHAQRPRRWTLVGVALSLAGLALVLDVAGGVRVDVGGVLWGLGAALGLATYFVLSARETEGLPPLVLAAGGLVVAAVALVVCGALRLVPLEWSTTDVVLAGRPVPWWAPLLGLCALSTSFAYATGVTATRALGSKLASFVGLTEVMFSVLIAWLLLDELPLPVQLLGGVLIVAGVVAVRYDELANVASPGSPVCRTDVVDPAPVVPTTLAG
ncbi:MAG TPA: DMT family transporter [Actinomycetales bacterium]|nr:DMT family transporter [Actinomycetales bacterium]